MNSIFKTTTLIILFVSSIQACLKPERQIRDITQRSVHILNKHCSQTKKEQLRLLRELKNIPCSVNEFWKDPIALVIDALAHKNTFTNVTKNK